MSTGASLTVLDAGLGVTAGAIVPSGWTPAEGTRALVLGSDTPGIFRVMSPGEYIGVEQVADIGDGTLLRLRAHLRPGALPAGLSWSFVVRFNDEDRVTRAVSREVDCFDIAVPIALFYGTMSYGFRLVLLGTDGIYPVELPGVYVDALFFDLDTTNPVLINRVPEPGETGVPITSTIFVEVANILTTTDIGLVGIYIDGVLACDHSGEQNGFTVVFTTYPDTNDFGYLITPPAPFPGETVIPVRVVVSDPGLLDVTYSFTTADVSPPRVVSAVALDEKTIRVALSENVVQLDPEGAANALNPANWTITLLSTSLDDGLPAVPLLVVGVNMYDTATVELVTDIDMTAGALYLVTCANVVDLSGNIVASPFNTATFTGYACPVVEGRSFELINFLPAMNVAEDVSGDLRRFIACLQETTNLVLCDVDRWADILDPDIAPERFIDTMLVEAGNPFDFNLSLVDKRRLVRVLVPIYRGKGTDAGIIGAIRFFMGIEVTITVPAFLGIWDLGVSELGVDTVLGTSDAAARYTFVVNVPIVLTDEERARMIALVTYMKAAHTHFLISEPTAPPADPDHWELGLSNLGENTVLH